MRFLDLLFLILDNLSRRKARVRSPPWAS